MLSDPRLILSVDIGTSRARGILYDDQAHPLSEAATPYPILLSARGWSEQNPEQIVSAVKETIHKSVSSIPVGNRLTAVVFSSQMYSILALSEHGEALTNSLTWSDQRAAQQAQALRERPESTTIQARTGCPIQPIYPLSKILWLRTNLDLPAKARYVSIKDFVLLRLTNHLISDWSTASASGMFDIHAREWSQEALRAAGLAVDQLPQLAPPRHIIDSWNTEIALEIGVPPDLPLILGGGDAPLANIGVGAVMPDAVAVNVGSSAAARVLLPEPRVDPLGRLWTYVADQATWTLGGLIGAGGAAYQWLLSELHLSDNPEEDISLFQRADQLAGEVSVGSDSLLFLPFLAGTQSPDWDAGARGVLHGLALHHHRGHLIRSMLEGIAFALLEVVETITDTLEADIHQAYLTGGVSTSSVWRQIVTDTFGVPVWVPRSHEASARGAAILGWLALGIRSDYGDFPTPEILGELLPDQTRHREYREHYQSFLRLKQSLKSYSNMRR